MTVKFIADKITYEINTEGDYYLRKAVYAPLQN
jgi:hypothetical protein